MTAEARIIPLSTYKIRQDDFVVDFKLDAQLVDERKKTIEDGLYKVNELLTINEDSLTDTEKMLNKYQNQSDKIDYTIAVTSGLLAGIIDILWVGEFDLERGRKWGSDKTNRFVIKVAEKLGYKDKVNKYVTEDMTESEQLQSRLQEAIKALEGKFGAPSDSNTPEFGGGHQHRLRDFAHHPNIVGLIFSLLTQFTYKSYGTNTEGQFIVVDVKSTAFIGKNIFEKFTFGVIYWFFHLVSDMAGTSDRPGAGTGIPGPLLSLAKELSALPFFNSLKIGDQSLSVWLSKLFNGSLLKNKETNERLRFDLRAEIGLAYELGRQALPVIINESIVRGLYFVRRFAMQVKEKNVQALSDLKEIKASSVLPFNNRTIVRMLTISIGTFTALDLGDAAIKALMKSKGNKGVFLKEFALRVNFVGVGRLVIAIGTDVTMGVIEHKHRNDRIKLLNERLHLMNSKVFLMQADTFMAAELTEKAIADLFIQMEDTLDLFLESWNETKKSLNNIKSYKSGVETHNPDLIKDMADILKWG